MKLQEVITTVNELEPNIYTDERLVSFINEVEMMLVKTIDDPRSYYELKRLEDQSEYDLPTAVQFDNIKSVLLEGVRILHVGLDHDEELPGYRESITGKFEIFPVADSDQSENDIKIIYQVAQEKLDYDTDKDVQLLALPPYDEMYHLYTMAKVNFFNKDFATYNNLIDQYNDVLKAFKIETIRKKPINKKSHKFKNIW